MPADRATTAPQRGTWYGTCPRCSRPLTLTSSRDEKGSVVSTRCRHCPPAKRTR